MCDIYAVTTDALSKLTGFKACTKKKLKAKHAPNPSGLHCVGVKVLALGFPFIAKKICLRAQEQLFCGFFICRERELFVAAQPM